jgi:hypothetical protein
MEQLAKVATPAVAAVGSQVRVPGPPVAGVAEVIESVTVEVSVVTVLPPASSTATAGWVPKAVPPVAAAGDVVKARWVAWPTVTLNELEVAGVSDPSVAVSVCIPALLTEQPVKAATPAAAPVGAQPESPPGPEPTAKVTVDVAEVTVLPSASSIVTTGWVAKAVPPLAPAGSVVIASWLASPGPTSNGALVTSRLSVASEAVSVYSPATLMVQPLKVTAPPPVVVEQPDSGPGPEWLVRVMAFVSVVTVLFPAS